MLVSIRLLFDKYKDTHIDEVVVQMPSITGDDDLDAMVHAVISSTPPERTIALARIAHYIFGNNYACTAAGKWYSVMAGGRWQRRTFAHVRRTFCDHLVDFLQSIRDQVSDSAKIDLVIRDIQSNTLILVRAFGTFFHENDMYFDDATGRHFEARLDNVQPNMIFFTNGGYDIEQRGFRKYIPTDFIVYNPDIFANHPYICHAFPVKPNHLVRDDIRHWLSKVIPDNDQREFALAYITACLVGQDVPATVYINQTPAYPTVYIEQIGERQSNAYKFVKFVEQSLSLYAGYKYGYVSHAKIRFEWGILSSDLLPNHVYVTSALDDKMDNSRTVQFAHEICPSFDESWIPEFSAMLMPKP